MAVLWYMCANVHHNEMLSDVAKYSKEQALTLSFAPFRQEDNIKACRRRFLWCRTLDTASQRPLCMKERTGSTPTCSESVLRHCCLDSCVMGQENWPTWKFVSQLICKGSYGNAQLRVPRESRNLYWGYCKTIVKHHEGCVSYHTLK